MKRVLFIGVTKYNLEKPELQLHLKKKFEGLSKEIGVLVLAKGKPFHRKIWNTVFYLLPPNFLFWPLALCVGFYLCATKKIDTIVAQSPLMEGFLGSVLKLILRKELIVEIHGDWEEGPFLSKKRKLEFLQRKIVPLLARISFGAADKIRAISSFTLEKARRACPQKPYFVFPTFTDLSSFLAEKETKFDNFILFVGQLEKVKGVGYLIEAFSKISLDFPEFKLVIIGKKGSEFNNLKSQARDFGIENRVEFLGALSLKETKDIMKNCYCLVLPSLSEGLGRVLMEAEALGKPVIGSRIGGIPDLIKDGQNGFLFEVGNSDQLAEKLRTLLKDRNLAAGMGEVGREFVERNFSNQKYLENYIQMINS